jgi:hypothetical protein
MIRRCLLVALAACGGDDTMATIDAAPQIDSAPANCLVMADYGALGAKTGTAGTMGGVTATVTLDAGPPRDTFFLKMVTGKGVFAGGINPGTYTISGVDAQYLNCGLCVHIIADIVTGAGPSKFYFADSGSVTLTSTAPPIAGSATNLTFKEVDISSGQFVTNGCTSTIGSISFTTP